MRWVQSVSQELSGTGDQELKCGVFLGRSGLLHLGVGQGLYGIGAFSLNILDHSTFLSIFWLFLF